MASTLANISYYALNYKMKDNEHIREHPCFIKGVEGKSTTCDEMFTLLQKEVVHSIKSIRQSLKENK